MSKITIDREVLAQIDAFLTIEELAPAVHDFEKEARQKARDYIRKEIDAALTAAEDRPVAGPDTMRAAPRPGPRS